MDNKQRIALEKRIVRYALTSAEDAGWKVHSVDDGGALVKVNSIEDAINTVFSVDTSTVKFRNAELKSAALFIVLGNGYDVLTDYTFLPNMSSFSNAMTKAENYVNSLQEKGTLKNPSQRAKRGQVTVQQMIDRDLRASGMQGTFRKGLLHFDKSNKPELKLSQSEMLASVRKNPVSTEARELFLFITNDGDLYRQQTQPIILNLRKKIKHGVYNSELAVKLWRYLADSGAKKYNKEYIGITKGFGIFTVPMRNEVARELSVYYSDEVNMNKNPGTLRATRKPSRRLNKQTHYDTGSKTGRYVYVQEQRGAMWVSLAVVKDSDKGRKQAQQWAQIYHRKHPAHRLRIFV